MAFRSPFVTVVGPGVRVICYIDTPPDSEAAAFENIAAEEHLSDVFATSEALARRRIDYAIAFLWRHDSFQMVDLWVFSETNTWGSGPLADVFVFKDTEPTLDLGVSSGNVLIVLGREEEYRRQARTLDEYLNGERPDLPSYLATNP